MDDKKKNTGLLPPAHPVELEKLIEYSEGSVVSRTLVKNPAGTVTLFSFDADQGLSEHTAPYDALIQILDGNVELTIGGEKVHASVGQTVLMPAGIPHAVQAAVKCKMLLIMIRG